MVRSFSRDVRGLAKVAKVRTADTTPMALQHFACRRVIVSPKRASVVPEDPMGWNASAEDIGGTTGPLRGGLDHDASVDVDRGLCEQSAVDGRARPQRDRRLGQDDALEVG